MSQGSFWRTVLFFGLPLVAVALGFLSICQAERPGEAVKEPVYRVSKAVPGTGTVPVNRVANQHPLVPAIEIAENGLKSIRTNIKDYTATLVKRERINGELSQHEFATIKVRHERVEGGKVVPFAVYMKFLKPATIKGREVIWVKGDNNNKLYAHEAGGLLPSVWLDPNGFLAMRGQKYPISEIGMENLAVKLIERANQDMAKGPCEVSITPNFKVNGRNCTLIQVTHPEKDPKFLFHIARVYIDSELNIPIRYEAHLWPTVAGGTPEVDEEYTYVDVKVNVGLKNSDFDPNNPNYNF